MGSDLRTTGINRFSTVVDITLIQITPFRGNRVPGQMGVSGDCRAV